MELPTKPSPAARKNPGQIVIFGKPKCGKTTICAELTAAEKYGKWMLLELENGGSDYVEAVQMNVPKIMEEEKKDGLKVIREIGQTIINAGKPYDGIIVDTVTKLEEMIMPLACQLYRKTPYH